MVESLRRFKRPLGDRRYKKAFIIATEGANTEPQYFNFFDNRQAGNKNQYFIRVKCLKTKTKSSPVQVLKRMSVFLRKESLRKSDEAWIVVDKDTWTDAQLQNLYEWAQGNLNYGLAVSNPKFEYWLLLHYENGDGVGSSQVCMDRLKRYIPDYDKGIDPRKITLAMITDAIQRAKRRDNPPCTDWPSNLGSTVYRLVEKILSA